MPPKRQKGKRMGRKRRNNTGLGQALMTRTVSVPFRDITTIPRTASSGLEFSSINLNIASFASGSRPRVLGAIYEYYRFKSLRIRAIFDSLTGAVSGDGLSVFFGMIHALGFVPSAQSMISTPSTLSDLMNFPNAVINGTQTPNVITLNRRMMDGSNPVKWFHTTVTGTPPNDELSPGTIIHCTRTLVTQTSNRCNSYIELSGVLEFKSPLPTGSTFDHDTVLTRLAPALSNVESLEVDLSSSSSSALPLERLEEKEESAMTIKLGPDDQPKARGWFGVT